MPDGYVTKLVWRKTMGVNLKSLLMCCAALLAAAACAGNSNSIEYGRVMLPRDVPGSAVPCAEGQMTRTHHVPVQIPGDVIHFYMVADHNGLDRVPIQYDVTPDGETANLKFVGSERYLEHRTRQKLISAVGAAVAQWRFEWNGSPRYGVGCVYEFGLQTTGF